MKIIKEFKEFISRGNVIDMAVGVIIGGAFTAIVNALVDNILNPLIGIITGGVDFYGLKEAGEVSYEIGGWISNSTNQSYSATIIQPYYL